MMWNDHYPRPPAHFSYGKRISKSAPCSPVKPLLKRNHVQPDSYHVIHKVPMGDTPYVKAKHVQLVEKDPHRAIALFWAAINAGDRVDSALKDMAIVMKQQNRAEEAIEAIKSLRNRCSDQAQESLDNVLLDLYKRCGRLDDQIVLLKHKLHLIHLGLAFNGKRTKTARSQGKKFQVSIEQEATRLLGNLGWAYMQQGNYVAAEAVYRKALSIESDNNKVCNLGICLMKQCRLSEAKTLLQSVKPASANGLWGLDSHLKSYERAQEMLRELEGLKNVKDYHPKLCEHFEEMPKELDKMGSAIEVVKEQNEVDCQQYSSASQSQHSKPLSRQFGDSGVSGALFATAGFGPSRKIALESRHQVRSTCLYSTWDDDEGDDAHAFGDENSDNNAVGKRVVLGVNQVQEQTHWHADWLSSKLEKLSMDRDDRLERSFSFPVPPLPPHLNKHTLNSDAAPFVAKSVAREAISWNAGCLTNTLALEGKLLPTVDDSTAIQTNFIDTCNVFGGKWTLTSSSLEYEGDSKPDETAVELPAATMLGNRPSSRRSLSLESLEDHLHFPSYDHNHQQPPVLPGSEHILPAAAAAPRQPPIITKQTASKASKALFLAKDNCSTPPPPPPTPPANNNSKPLLSLVKESSEPSWSALGFTQSPDKLDLQSSTGSVVVTLATALASSTAPLASSSSSGQALSRRLRVFQEITLPTTAATTTSPQHVSCTLV